MRLTLLLLVFAWPAHARPTVRLPAPKTLRKAERPMPTGRREVKAFSDRGTTTARHGLNGTIGLKGFVLDFRNGEHKLKTAEVLVDRNRELRIGWGDNDGNDPMSYRVQVGQLRGRAMGEATNSTRCSKGTCKVPIQRPRRGETFVLTGFSFVRNKGDTNVRRLAIKPRPEAGIVEVTFIDTRAFNYKARIRYAYVSGPATERSERSSRRGGTYGAAKPKLPARPVGARVGRTGGNRFLQGFDLQFTNGGHDLRSFGVTEHARGYELFWNDADLDDPCQLSVNYVVLR